MQETTAPMNGFPVDLTREEYVAYHMLSARTVGPLRGRRWQLGMSVLLFLLLVGAVVYGYVTYGETDWAVALFALLLFVAATALWIAIPIRTRRQAEQAYDRTVESGYSFYGTVEVRPTELVKVGQELTTSVSFNANALFIEDKDMLVWICRQGRAIVLPARCLTPDTAAAVRAAADRLPPQNRRLVARLVPGCEPVEAPTPVETVTLWERQVRYTPAEYVAIAKARVLSHFWQRLPLTVTTGLALTLVFSWPEDTILPTVLTFLAVMAVQVVFGLVMPLSRLSRTPEELPASLTTVTVTFTDRGVKLRGGDQFASVPWSAVEHVYDRGDYAELLYEKQSLRIPKREIEDIEAFDRLLKEYWRNSK